jgi:hypothetical protein
MRKLKFSDAFKEFSIKRSLSDLEMVKVREGKEPEHMDSKWIIYFEDPWLYFHRFLTGICMYKVHIICIDSNYEIDKILINGDPELYKINNEGAEETFIEILNLFLESKI